MGVFPFLKFYKLHQIVQSNTNWTKWLSFVYKTSGCGFESRCPHRVWKTWINVFLENAKENLGKSDFFVNMIQGKVGNVSATCLFSCQNCFLQYVFKCIIIYLFFLLTWIIIKNILTQSSQIQKSFHNFQIGQSKIQLSHISTRANRFQNSALILLTSRFQRPIQNQVLRNSKHWN